nr:PREDICTED: uncharacterized protein LOC105668350 [Linepithema humile]
MRQLDDESSSVTYNKCIITGIITYKRRKQRNNVLIFVYIQNNLVKKQTITKMLKLEVPTLKEVLKNSGGDEKLLEELLSKFRLWLKQQSHLPQDISDQRLKFFIYAVKFNFEKAKKNLDTLYTLRNLVPELFENFDPFSDDINLLHTYFQNIGLPKLTPEGYRLYICRLIQDDSPMYNAWTILKYVCNIYKAEQIYYFTKI